MLGGGMIATAVKHSRIDDARSAIHAAQNSLRRSRTEQRELQRRRIALIENAQTTRETAPPRRGQYPKTKLLLRAD